MAAKAHGAVAITEHLPASISTYTDSPSFLPALGSTIGISATREIPLPGIEDQVDVKPLILNILSSAPVNQFITVTASEREISAKLLSPSLQQAVAG